MILFDSFGDYQGQTLNGSSCNSANFPGPMFNTINQIVDNSSWPFNGLDRNVLQRSHSFQMGCLWKMVLENCHHHLGVLSPMLPRLSVIDALPCYIKMKLWRRLFGALERDVLNVLIALLSALWQEDFMALFIYRGFALINPEK